MPAVPGRELYRVTTRIHTSAMAHQVICQHVVMSRTRRSGRRVRQIAAAVTILVALAASFFLTGPMISGLHSVTRGNEAADVAVGILLLIAPMAAIVGYAYLAHRRRWPGSLCSWRFSWCRG
jgi:hypothetical protein